MEFKNKVSILSVCFQLSDAVSVIGREDFPDKWTNLLQVGHNKKTISCHGGPLGKQNHHYCGKVQNIKLCVHDKILKTGNE